MSIVFGVLQEEYDRLQQLAAKYRTELSNLPKGSLQTKQRNGHTYVYLAYREQHKVISEYIGKADSPGVAELRRQVQARKQYEQKLKQISTDLREIRQVLHGKSGKAVR
jgi:hypothetical protein